MPKQSKNSRSSSVLSLSNAKSIGWSQMNNIIRTSALEACRIFGMTFIEFQQLAVLLGIKNKDRMKNKRWFLDLFDLLLISFFILFYKELGESEEVALEHAKEALQFQRRLHVEYKGFDLRIRPYTKSPQIKEEDRKKIESQHSDAEKVIDFYRKNFKMGFGTTIRCAMIYNQEYLNDDLKWLIWLEPHRVHNAEEERNRMNKIVAEVKRPRGEPEIT